MNQVRLDPLHLILAGIVGLVFTFTSLTAAAQPPAKAVSANKPTSANTATTSAPKSMEYSVPTTILIPSIMVETKLITVGKNSDGTLHVPENPAIAGWYQHSPSPGQTGPSIIAGHVDTKDGPAVFWRIGELKAGEEIRIIREKGDAAVFTVNAIEIYDQDNFPTEKVYGNTSNAELRLITCGGKYNPFTNRYSHNVVVYATLK